MPHGEEHTINGEVNTAGLSIGQLAARTGVPQATLRTWEARYGMPRPRRLAAGHRRYVESDIALVQEIVRNRAAGQSLRTAVDAAARLVDAPEPSVFAGLRRRHPHLTPQVLSKSSLLALTRAIEDECCARAESPVLFAAFQQERFYRRSASRWEELARTASAVVVFADFGDRPASGISPLEVPIPSDSPLCREWALVCDAPDYPACVAAWEYPGQNATPDAGRRFETVWTVDASIVRDAAHICADLATTFAPGTVTTLKGMLSGTPQRPSADLQRADGLLHRMVGYLERSRRG